VRVRAGEFVVKELHERRHRRSVCLPSFSEQTLHFVEAALDVFHALMLIHFVQFEMRLTSLGFFSFWFVFLLELLNVFWLGLKYHV